MTALDNLSKLQFMRTEDIGKMRSGNRYGTGEHTVAEWMQDHLGTLDGPRAAKPDEPVEVGIGDSKHVNVLYNGHHRYADAVRAGRENMPVTAERSWAK